MTSLQLLRREVRRAVLARRRVLAATLAGLAVVATVQAARPDPESATAVVAATDLRAGSALTPSDVERVEVTPELLPEGALDPDAVPFGRSLAGPVRAGEPLTDVRLVQPELLAGFDTDTVLTTIRVVDPAAADLVDPGDRVDVVGADPRGARAASIVASNATVIDRPDSGDNAAVGDGAPLVLAVDRATALSLADAAVRQQLTVLVTS